MRRLALTSLVLLSAGVACGQAHAWRPRSGAGVCVPSASTATPRDATGCGELGIPSDAFHRPRVA